MPAMHAVPIKTAFTFFAWHSFRILHSNEREHCTSHLRSSQQRLLLALRSMLSLDRRLGARSSREILFRDIGRAIDTSAGQFVCGILAQHTLIDSRLLCGAHQFSRLRRVLLHGVLGGFYRLACVLVRQVADLVGLLVEQVLGVGDVAIDDTLVLDVDERNEEGKGSEEESKAPSGCDFDEEVGQECGEKGL